MGSNAPVYLSHVRTKRVSVNACIRMHVLESREHASALFHVGSNGLMERSYHRSERKQEELPPSTSFACLSILQAEFLHELPALGQISTFATLQTRQCSSDLYSNFKVRAYKISVSVIFGGKVDCSFEELFYSIRNWITLKLIAYNELQIKLVAGMMGSKFDSPSQMHTYIWTLIHRTILNS